MLSATQIVHCWIQSSLHYRIWAHSNYLFVWLPGQLTTAQSFLAPILTHNWSSNRIKQMSGISAEIACVLMWVMSTVQQLETMRNLAVLKWFVCYCSSTSMLNEYKKLTILHFTITAVYSNALVQCVVNNIMSMLQRDKGLKCYKQSICLLWYLSYL